MNAKGSLGLSGRYGSENGPIILTGGSISIQWLPESDQKRLLASATDLIVNRTGPIHDPLPMTENNHPVDAIRRLDEEHSHSSHSHLAEKIAEYQGQLRGSVDAIRQSIMRLESKLRNQELDRIDAKPPIRTKIESLGKKSSPPAATATNQPSSTRPRLWRRWVRIDQYIELRERTWRSKASRFGMELDIEYLAPTGQEHWTDIDALLNIIDHLMAMAIGSGQRDDRISLHVVHHADDEHWLQFSIRSGRSERNAISPQRVPGSNHRRDRVDVGSLELAMAQRYATMLGGYLDQLASREDGVCWNLHLPADDLLSWLRRAAESGHQHMVEVTLIDSAPNAAELKRAILLDRSLQATLDSKGRVIQLAAHRYLWSGFDLRQDLSGVAKRFAVELERIGGAIGMAAKHQIRVDLQPLGSLRDVLQKIDQRLAQKHPWTIDSRVGSKVKAAAPASNRRSAVPAPKTQPKTASGNRMPTSK